MYTTENNFFIDIPLNVSSFCVHASFRQCAWVLWLCLLIGWLAKLHTYEHWAHLSSNLSGVARGGEWVEILPSRCKISLICYGFMRKNPKSISPPPQIFPYKNYFSTPFQKFWLRHWYYCLKNLFCTQNEHIDKVSSIYFINIWSSWWLSYPLCFF